MIIIYIILCVFYGVGLGISIIASLFERSDEGFAIMMAKAIFWPIHALALFLKKVFRL